ncbi:MAG: RNA methyltransferase [Planctomycetota bacterium]
MSEPDAITSLTNPRVKRIVRLRKARQRRREGVLLAEGWREVSRALAAGLELIEWFACRELVDARAPDPPDPPERADWPGGEPTWVSAAMLAKMAYHDKPEGVLAVFIAPTWSLDQWPATRSDSGGGGGGGFFLVAVGTEKPGNLGAMVRTAAVAGCDGVLAVGPAVDVFNPNAIRNSTGAVFALPTVVVEDPAEAVAWLRSRGVTIAAALADGGADCFRQDWAEPGGSVAVVVGPEHAGLDDTWRDAADVKLTIPQATSGGAGVTDSLNAANAAAVLLFEAVRRRTVLGSTKDP